MVGFYQRRNPLYNVKAELHKCITPEDGSAIYYDPNPIEVFYAKDNGFETVYSSQNGHTEKVTVGQLETKDLEDGAIMPDDSVMYYGQMYIVTKVKFVDDDKQKFKSNRASGTTIIDLRK